jgi:hypothetical protein
MSKFPFPNFSFFPSPLFSFPLLFPSFPSYPFTDSPSPFLPSIGSHPPAWEASRRRHRLRPASISACSPPSLTPAPLLRGIASHVLPRPASAGHRFPSASGCRRPTFPSASPCLGLSPLGLPLRLAAPLGSHWPRAHLGAGTPTSAWSRLEPGGATFLWLRQDE